LITIGGGLDGAPVALQIAVPLSDVQHSLQDLRLILWLVTFAAVIPSGLLLAHKERLSLRKLSEESHRAEEADIGASNP